MKDEIKEIIDGLNVVIKQEGSLELDFKECKKILDYITNLQKENERLKENAIHNDKVVDKARWNEMIYKSRNEKAIGYINKLSNKPNVFGHYGIDGNCKKYLLNILNGDDNDKF